MQFKLYAASVGSDGKARIIDLSLSGLPLLPNAVVFPMAYKAANFCVVADSP